MQDVSLVLILDPLRVQIWVQFGILDHPKNMKFWLSEPSTLLIWQRGKEKRVAQPNSFWPVSFGQLQKYCNSRGLRGC